MFSEKQKKGSAETGSNGEQNKIARGTKFVGDIESKGCFRIEGTVEGNLNTLGKIVIGKSGFVNGTITCANADVEGRFSGKLGVGETLTLRSTALIEGEVSVGKLAIEPGATFNATCEMKGSEVKTLKDDRKGKEGKEAKKAAGA